MQAIHSHSDRPINIDHASALGLASTLILFDFLIARTLGNGKWFGLLSLLGASAAGYTLFMSVAAVFFERTSTVSTNLITAWAALSILFLPPALFFPLIIRAMAYPIIGVFRPDR